MIRIVLEKSEDRIRKLSELQRQPDIVRIDYFSEDGYKYLYESLETYCQLYNSEISVELDFPLWQHKPDQSLFAALVYEESSFSNNATYTQKALFYAQTEYLRRVTIPKFDKEKFLYWMRVVRNIVSRGDAEKTGKRAAIIRSPEAFNGVINLISELSEGCDDIYDFLATHSIKSEFAKYQVEEEILKSKLILENDNYKNVIFLTEDTNFCMGRIEFPLYCIDYDREKNNFNDIKLSEIKEVIKNYLDKEQITNDLRRGLLTISDDNGLYNYYNYWWSFSYVVSSNKRCLIDKYYELEYYVYGNYKDREEKKGKNYYREYLKKLLFQLTTKDLKDIISDFIPPQSMPNWKVRLIKESDLLDERCKSNYIAIPDDESCCYLLKGMRPRDIDDCEKIE
jgi:hypothetical protein